MASLKQIRAAIKTTIEAGISGIQVHREMPDQGHGDVVLVEPDGTDFHKAFGRGLDEYSFNLYVLVMATDLVSAQDRLDDYVTGAGDKSIRQVIFQNQDLGLNTTSASVSKMFGYNGKYKLAEILHVGAVLKLTVMTDGST